MEWQIVMELAWEPYGKNDTMSWNPIGKMTAWQMVMEPYKKDNAMANGHRAQK